MHELGLPVQQMVLVKTHVEDLLADVAAIAIQAVLSMLVEDHLALKGQLLGVFVVEHTDATNLGFVLKVRAILDFNQLAHASYPEFIFKYEVLRIVEPLEIQATRLQIPVEEVGSLATLKKLMHRSIEELLQDLKLVSRSLPEEVLIDTPELQLHLQHLVVVLLDLVEFSLVSDEVNHHVEGEGIAIDEHPIVLCLQSVATGEHSR